MHSSQPHLQYEIHIMLMQKIKYEQVELRSQYHAYPIYQSA